MGGVAVGQARGCARNSLLVPNSTRKAVATGALRALAQRCTRHTPRAASPDTSNVKEARPGVFARRKAPRLAGGAHNNSCGRRQLCRGPRFCACLTPSVLSLPLVQYATAVAAGNVYKASSVTGIASPLQTQGVSLVDAMSFNGVPELINGRLAMIAIVAALAAELSSHETVLRQLADQPTGVVLVAVLIAAASLVPVVEGKADTKSPLGFLNASAEMVNSRAAMMGFVALLCTERLIGHSLL